MLGKIPARGIVVQTKIDGSNLRMIFQKVIHGLMIQATHCQIELASPRLFSLVLCERSTRHGINGSFKNCHSGTVLIIGRNQKTVFLLTSGYITTPSSLAAACESRTWCALGIQAKENTVFISSTGCLVNGACIAAKTKYFATNAAAIKIRLNGFVASIRYRWLKGFLNRRSIHRMRHRLKRGADRLEFIQQPYCASESRQVIIETLIRNISDTLHDFDPEELRALI